MGFIDMSDITFMDTSDPEELADELDTFAHQYAKKTGNYEMADNLLNAAQWLRRLNERVAEHEN